ncbi:DNA polymerase I [Bienertia sinuspersici]
MAEKGIFLVHFDSQEHCDEARGARYQFFDGKLVIMKPWTMDMDIKKLPGLELQYWGEKTIFQLVSELGNPIKLDQVTAQKDKLQYARVLVDMVIDKPLSVDIALLNEKGLVVNQVVAHELKPVFCEKCKTYGHKAERCAKKDGRVTSKSRRGKAEVQGDKRAENEEEVEEGQQVVQGQRTQVKRGQGEGIQGLFSLHETRVKIHKLGNVYLNLCSGWCFTSNLSKHPNGSFIMGWNPLAFQVNILHMNSELIHCEVFGVGVNKQFNMTFVYGFNERRDRESLWSELKEIWRKCMGSWLVMGDFSSMLHLDGRIGDPVRLVEVMTMRDCIEHCRLLELKSVGRTFTWTNKQELEDTVLSKIDWVLLMRAGKTCILLLYDIYYLKVMTKLRRLKEINK